MTPRGAGDVFKEQIVKREPNMRDTMKKAGIILGAAVIILASMMFLPSILPLAVLGAGFGAYYLFMFTNAEYEYIFTNGDLDIDCIYGKSRRVRVFSGDVKSDKVEIMVPVGERGYDAQFNKAKKRRDCGSGVLGERSYQLLVSYKGKWLSLTVEPNEALMAAMSPYLGIRKLIKKR